MDLLEYQGKKIFASYGVPIPDGKPAKGAKKAGQIAEKLGTRVVVLSLIHI